MLDLAIGPPGGYHIYRFSRAPGAPSDLLIAPADSPLAARMLLETPASEETPSLSADGRLLAYVSNHTGIREVYVRRVPGPDQRLQVSIGGGEEPAWTSDREIIYRGRGWFRSVTITTEPELDIGPRDSLFADVFAPLSSARNYDVFPNGDLAVVERSGPAERLIGITNWTPSPIPLRLAPAR